MKVRINATGDTIVLKFVKPNPDTKLEGYILGYGSSMFSKQFIQLPENGKPYETEIDAEPKYLVAVQPIPTNDVKKQCTGKVNLDKPLHLVVGSVTPTSVLLSWGTFVKTPYEGDIMSDCLEDGYYTIRYRERNRKWIYQTCPTSDTVIDNLKPNTPYEFGVRSNKDDRGGVWSKPVIHNTNMGGLFLRNSYNVFKAVVSIVNVALLPFLSTQTQTAMLEMSPLWRAGILLPSPFSCPPPEPLVIPQQPPPPPLLLPPQPPPPPQLLPPPPPPAASPRPRQLMPLTSLIVHLVIPSFLILMSINVSTAPHVVYKTDKKPDEPCSITTSLSYFPEDEAVETNITSPPRTAPSNLTVVTVEGCPSFIILDWEKPDNETTEYEVISTTKGPDGEKVSILTTNQTHTAVENLKPESSYEFKVKPKNELGEGPSSEPVSFSTESADPRVSENVSGKDAIWTQFPFKTDSHSECNGKQYVKRTWYRKFVGIQLCNSLRYKIYLSDSLNGKFYNIGDQTGHGEDHCQFVDSFLDGRTGTQQPADQLPARTGFYRAVRQEPVHFGPIGGNSHITYVAWYECGTPIPGKW
uniref:ABI family member 3 binding protein n=1 Tax=Astyanax mexicanus TaxID=7994 RepID=A0A8B9JJF2_ASTMX